MGSEDEPLDVQVTSDLDLALATAGIDLVIVGGPLGFRAEALRRAAAEGLPIICLHPPGEDSEAYYQVVAEPRRDRRRGRPRPPAPPPSRRCAAAPGDRRGRAGCVPGSPS